MPQTMSMDDLNRHRDAIVDFLGAWGYQLARGSVLFAQFKDCVGLRIQFDHGFAITKYPEKDGKTCEFFLRQALDAAHESLWKSVREIEMEPDLNHPNAYIHYDGRTLTRWVHQLAIDDQHTIIGGLQDDDIQLITKRFEGKIEGDTPLFINGEELSVMETLPQSMIESLRIKWVREVFSDLPRCSDERINKAMDDLLIFNAAQDGDWLRIKVMDCKRQPLPGYNPEHLWRRIREVEPVTCMIDFSTPGEEIKNAPAHKARIQSLVREMDEEDRCPFIVIPRIREDA